MILVCILVGASNGIYLTMDTSLAVDTLDVDAGEGINENDDGAAQLLGIWGVFGFLGATLGPIIGGTALVLLGHIPKSNSSSIGGLTNTTQVFASSQDGIANASLPSYQFYNIHGYEALFSLSAFYFFCSALTLGFVKKKGV